jgi:hypothetical protein
MKNRLVFAALAIVAFGIAWMASRIRCTETYAYRRGQMDAGRLGPISLSIIPTSYSSKNPLIGLARTTYSSPYKVEIWCRQSCKIDKVGPITFEPKGSSKPAVLVSGATVEAVAKFKTPWFVTLAERPSLDYVDYEVSFHMIVSDEHARSNEEVVHLTVSRDFKRVWSNDIVVALKSGA